MVHPSRLPGRRSRTRPPLVFRGELTGFFSFVKTIIRTRPAFFAAETDHGNPEIAPGNVRFHCVTLETFEMEAARDELELAVPILAALADENPDLRARLRQLREHLQANGF